MSASTEGPSKDLLLASIAVILLAVFAGMSRNRITSEHREQRVLRSVAGEFRRLKRTSSELPSATLFREQKRVGDLEVQLPVLVDSLFTAEGELSELGAQELGKLGESLRSGTTTLQLLFTVPGNVLEDEGRSILAAERRAERLEKFLAAHGAPKFSVQSQIALGSAEEIIFYLQGPEVRIRWQ